MEPILRLENLTFRYAGAGEAALKNINLTFEKGSFTAILGHNGSGKSTLAKHLNAILLPTEGRVLVNGMNTAEEQYLLPIRKTVGMVFQNPDNQIVASVVEDDVAFAPENLGVESSEIRRRVDEALKTVGQRVAIAGVLAMQPQVLVLDEPTAMLDPAGRAEVMRTVETLRRQGVTVVLITHHMTECIHCDRLIIMADGQVVMDGKPGEIFSRVEELRARELDVPETVSILYELRKAGMDVPLNALDSEDCAQAIAAMLHAGYPNIKDAKKLCRKFVLRGCGTSTAAAPLLKRSPSTTLTSPSPRDSWW